VQPAGIAGAAHVIRQGLAALGLKRVSVMPIRLMRSRRTSGSPGAVAPGQHQPDRTIEQQGERPHGAFGNIAVAVAVGEGHLPLLAQGRAQIGELARSGSR